MVIFTFLGENGRENRDDYVITTYTWSLLCVNNSVLHAGSVLRKFTSLHGCCSTKIVGCTPWHDCVMILDMTSWPFYDQFIHVYSRSMSSSQTPIGDKSSSDINLKGMSVIPHLCGKHGWKLGGISLSQRQSARYNAEFGDKLDNNKESVEWLRGSTVDNTIRRQTSIRMFYTTCWDGILMWTTLRPRWPLDFSLWRPSLLVYQARLLMFRLRHLQLIS